MKTLRILVIAFVVTIVGVAPSDDAEAWPTLCQGALTAYQSALADVAACMDDRNLNADWCNAALKRLTRSRQWIETNCAFSQ